MVLLLKDRENKRISQLRLPEKRYFSTLLQSICVSPTLKQAVSFLRLYLSRTIPTHKMYYHEIRRFLLMCSDGGYGGSCGGFRPVNNFALIVVLFVLLIIVGVSFVSW